jgi:hypothetical protein
MFKQICFFRKRADMTMEAFMDYYGHQHSQLSKNAGLKPALPGAQRYVRRYLKPEANPVTGNVIDPGYDCLMEIWWNSREDYEESLKIISDPVRLPTLKADEVKLFASHDNPSGSVIAEYDSPMGPNGKATSVVLKHG